VDSALPEALLVKVAIASGTLILYRGGSTNSMLRDELLLGCV
jgi:hypothetical protein